MIMRRWLVPSVGIVTVVVGGLLLWLGVWYMPQRLVPPAGKPNPTSTTTADPVQLENDRLKLQNDVRGTLLQGLGGTVLILGAFFTWQQLRATREGQVTDRYTKAVDQLGHEQLAVRLGGIYALQRIARDSPSDRDTIAEILCTYARTAKRESLPNKDLKLLTHDRATIVEVLRTYVRTAKRKSPSDEALKTPPLDQWAPDVQAVLTILGFWRRRVGGHAQWRDFHGGDYRGANLDGARLPDSFFYDAQLQDAQLKKANLEKANFSRAKLQRADLRGANLKDANLYDAELKEAKANKRTDWPEHWKDSARRRDAGIEEVD
jgi:hypothetical protein